VATTFTSQRSDESGWHARAACRDTNPDLFFPVGVTGAAIDEIGAAKAVCQSCPVREQCLQFALRTKQECGIWGGTSEEERRRLRRRMADTLPSGSGVRGSRAPVPVAWASVESE
jgi:WhiB family redox-sensing transcriptional regulator